MAVYGFTHSQMATINTGTGARSNLTVLEGRYSCQDVCEHSSSLYGTSGRMLFGLEVDGSRSIIAKYDKDDIYSMDSNGTLYGTSGFALYTINNSTAALTAVADFAEDGNRRLIHAMAFVGAVLYGVSGNILYSINTSTAALTKIGTFDKTIAIESITDDGAGGLLGSTGPTIVTINVTDASVTIDATLSGYYGCEAIVNTAITTGEGSSSSSSVSSASSFSSSSESSSSSNSSSSSSSSVEGLNCVAAAGSDSNCDVTPQTLEVTFSGVEICDPPECDSDELQTCSLPCGGDSWTYAFNAAFNDVVHSATRGTVTYFTGDGWSTTITNGVDMTFYLDGTCTSPNSTQTEDVVLEIKKVDSTTFRIIAFVSLYGRVLFSDEVTVAANECTTFDATNDATSSTQCFDCGDSFSPFLDVADAAIAHSGTASVVCTEA